MLAIGLYNQLAPQSKPTPQSSNSKLEKELIELLASQNERPVAIYNIVKYANFVFEKGSQLIGKSIGRLNLPEF